ncbi:MAG: hypothetical protein NZM43_09540 [Saprospiraceae bacterium]|nr:hypothetical protein [Saprospiraceae bacterium]MDW8484558.1 hypothetical protein [Saprospiraceae bacterium]
MTKRILAILLRIVLVFGAFVGLQYLIPYYLLVGGGIIAGIFTYLTSNDRPLAYGLLVGSTLFGIFAYLYGTV